MPAGNYYFTGHYDATHTGSDLTTVTQNFNLLPGGRGNHCILEISRTTSSNTSIYTFQAAGNNARAASGSVTPRKTKG